MEISYLQKIYLIYPTAHRYKTMYHEKIDYGIYIAKTEMEKERIIKGLKEKGYRNFKISEIPLKSLRYIPSSLQAIKL